MRRALLIAVAAATVSPRAEACNCGTYALLIDAKPIAADYCSPGQFVWHQDAAAYCCDDDSLEYIGGGTQTGCQANPPPIDVLAHYDCTFGSPTCTPGPDNQCDGIDNNHNGIVDEGCTDDSCREQDRDDHPVRFSSGRVEGLPVVAFSLPTPSDTFFGVELRWRSHFNRVPFATPIDSRISLDYFGRGWLDAYGDRLAVVQTQPLPLPQTASSVDWQSWDLTRHFVYASSDGTTARYTTSSGDFELLDHGAGATPRFVVHRLRDGKTWEFAGIDYTVPNASFGGRFGVLTRVADGGALAGTTAYSVALTRDASGHLQSAVDTFGRRLDFVVETVGITRVASVSYTPPGGAAMTVASFVYQSADPTLLSAVESWGNGAISGYTRFRYWSDPSIGTSTCPDCGGLIAEVVRSVTSSTLPADGAPAMTSELVTEGHLWAPSTRRPIAVGSYGPTSAWGYVYDQSSACATTGACRTIQADLLAPTGATCDRVAGTQCPSGSVCWSQDPNASTAPCYPAADIDYQSDTRHVTARSGHLLLGVGSFGYDAAGRLKWLIDSQNVRTTFSYDSLGRPACTVTGDDDEDAGLPPACAAPAGAQVTARSWNGSTETTTDSGLLPGSAGRTTIIASDAGGRPTSITRIGSTRAVDGTINQVSSTWSHQYDSAGRQFLETSPNETGGNVDHTTTSFYTSGPGTGLPYQVTHVYGPSGAPKSDVTTYANYDAFGVPLSITDPTGKVTQITISNNRRTWSYRETAGSLVRTTTRAFNAQGILAYTIDGDGVCVTYEHRPDADLQKRSASTDPSCAAIPIDTSSGEVQIDKHDSTGAALKERILQSGGAVAFDETFDLDDFRRISGVRHAGVLGRSYVYQSALLSEVDEGTCPGPDCTRTVHDVDSLGRTFGVRRLFADGTAATTDLAYGLGQVTASTITSGRDHGAGLVSSFVSDDFGRVVETTTANAGTSRREYDAVGRVIKERAGVGTALQRTRVHSYDAFGRETGIDEDVEHPVDCASAPSGTAIADLQRTWDACPSGDTPAGFTCANTSGRVAMERSVLGCLGGAVWSRATWYSYDGFGRVAATAIAQKNGATLAPAYTASYQWSPGNRPIFVGDPASASYGTAYGLDGVGHAVEAAASTSASYSSSQAFAWRSGFLPFGPDTRLTVSGNVVERSATYGSDYTVSGWVVDNGLGADYLNLSVQHDAASRFSSRIDSVAAGTSGATRYLARDSLGRVTCDSATAIGSDCSGGLVATSYADALLPDERQSATIQMPSYASAPDGYQYAPGTSQLTTLSRSGAPATTYVVDVLGRRTSEQENGTPSRSYGYLPSGRLGSISGTDTSGAAYALQLSYDSKGLVTLATDSISGYSEEYFYDLRGRLVAARRSGNEGRMIGAAWDGANGHVTTWYTDGTYAVGTVTDLDAVSTRRAFHVPSGESPANLLAVTMTANGTTYAYYRDGYASSGTAGNLGSTRTRFVVPSGESALGLRAVSITSTGTFYAWFGDGKYSSSTSWVSLGTTLSTYSLGTVLPSAILAIAITRGTSTFMFVTSGPVYYTGSVSSPAQTSLPISSGAPDDNSLQRWSFHWFGDAPVAATREVVNDGITEASRFYFVHDEQGIPIELVDGNRAVQFRQYLTASGWRWVSSRGNLVWMPFALPGQIVLDRTATTISGTALTKPALALNGLREYDPLVGGFLEPDPVDELPREEPEGYVYGRNDGGRFPDPSGAFAVKCQFSEEDSPADQATAFARMLAAASSAALQIMNCPEGACHKGERLYWAWAIMTAPYTCEDPAHKFPSGGTNGYEDSTEPGFPIHINPAIIRDPDNYHWATSDGGVSCLEQLIAHEGMHRLSDLVKDPFLDPDGHDQGQPGMPTGCVKCPSGAVQYLPQLHAN